MKNLLALLFITVIGCGADHEKERKDVCQHSEGFTYLDCNAGDDFSPLTCITAMDQFEGWWRGDVQTSINKCLISSACYAKADGIPGPSIEIPLQFCLNVELLSLNPTDSESDAARRYCTKAIACEELTYTISDCEEVLLNPYDQGQLFLMMSDDVANNVAACDQLTCTNFDSCVLTALHLAGAFSSVSTAVVKMPSLINIK